LSIFINLPVASISLYCKNKVPSPQFSQFMASKTLDNFRNCDISYRITYVPLVSMQRPREFDASSINVQQWSMVLSKETLLAFPEVSVILKIG